MQKFTNDTQILSKERRELQSNPCIKPAAKVETTTEGELFSPGEIQSLIIEMTSQLANCKNKSEQLNVIAQLALKYLYVKNK